MSRIAYVSNEPISFPNPIDTDALPRGLRSFATTCRNGLSRIGKFLPCGISWSVSEYPIWAAAAPLTPLAALHSLCVSTNTHRSRALPRPACGGCPAPMPRPRLKASARTRS